MKYVIIVDNRFYVQISNLLFDIVFHNIWRPCNENIVVMLLFGWTFHNSNTRLFFPGTSTVRSILAFRNVVRDVVRIPPSSLRILPRSI
jgi:hypothetical protein